MNKKDFIKRIRETERVLKKNHGTDIVSPWDRRYYGVCEALGLVFNGDFGEYDVGVPLVFANIFKPDDFESSFWISTSKTLDVLPKDIERRLVFLKLFELQCISNETYKEFEV